MTRPKLPVSSFGADMMATLILASKQEVIVPSQSGKRAINLIQKFYHMRTCMRDERHPYYAQAMKVKIQLYESDGSKVYNKVDPRDRPAIIVFRPIEQEFGDLLKPALKEANVNVPGPLPLPLPPLPSAPGPLPGNEELDPPPPVDPDASRPTSQFDHLLSELRTLSDE